MKYFPQLFNYWDSKDLSYIRRIRLFNTFKLILHICEKDLKDITLEEVNKIIAFINQQGNSAKTKSDNIKDFKLIYKNLFPVTIEDKTGKIIAINNEYPSIIKHISPKQDKSKEKRRDFLTIDEYKQILRYFSTERPEDIEIKALLGIIFDTCCRPQEALFIQKKGIIDYEEYAKILLFSHGKEGVNNGFLQVIDSYPYLIDWIRIHPKFENENDLLFINLGQSKNHLKQLKIENIRQKLKKACKELDINKRISPYSLKHSGITYKFQAGLTEDQVKHIARWTTSKMSSSYNHSTAEDVFERQLFAKGKNKEKQIPKIEEQKCVFCGEINPFEAILCKQCKRNLNRKEIEAKQLKDQESINKVLELAKINKDLIEGMAIINSLLKNKRHRKYIEVALKMTIDNKE